MGYDLASLDVTTTVTKNGKNHSFNIKGLANTTGVTCQIDNEIWLDWRDIITQPQYTRMHVYPAADSNVALSVKRERMLTWQQAILAFEAVMYDAEKVDAQGRINYLNSGKIPRPDLVVLPTRNMTLIRIFDLLGISPSETTEHTTTWIHLHSLAEQGAFLRSRKFAKNRQNV